MFDPRIKSPSDKVVLPGTGPQKQNEADRKGILYIDELYHPDWVRPEDAYRYVVGLPNQLVVDPANDVMYWITRINTESDLRPTLVPAFGTGGDDLTDTGIFGLPGGFQGEAVVGIDYTLRPNRAVIDGMVMCPGAAYAVLYQGNVVGELGKVISVTYGSNRELINQRVPVKLAAISNLDNREIMVTEPFSVNVSEQELPNGARTTLVWFDSEGNMIPKARSLTVMHTSIIRDHLVTKKYIKYVELVTPWYGDVNTPDVLKVPINTRLMGVAFRAKVHYHDGTTSDELPIDGNKIKLYGINEHKPSTVGQRGTLTLVYDLDKDESIYEARSGNPNQYSKSYWIETIEFDGAYSPKIYSYPDWQGGTYRLRHYLTDLDRAICIDVTEHVRLNELSPPFSPTTYGVEQSLELNLRLNDVVPTFNSTIMRQNITYRLKRPGDESGSKFSVRYSYDRSEFNDITFHATNDGNNRQNLRFGMEYGSVDAFLDGLYHSVEPSYRVDVEPGPLKPTHFEIVTSSGKVYEYKVEQWNQTFVLDRPEPQGRLVTLRFVKVDTQGNKLLLAVTGLSIDVKVGGVVNPPEPMLLQLDSTTPNIIKSDSIVNVKGMVYDQYGNPYRVGDVGVRLDNPSEETRVTATDPMGRFSFWIRPTVTEGEETWNFGLLGYDDKTIERKFLVTPLDNSPNAEIHFYSPSTFPSNRPGVVQGKLTRDQEPLPNYVLYYTIGQNLDTVKSFTTNKDGEFSITIPHETDHNELTIVIQNHELEAKTFQWVDGLVPSNVSVNRTLWVLEQNQPLVISGVVTSHLNLPFNKPEVKLGLSKSKPVISSVTGNSTGQFNLVLNKDDFVLGEETEVVVYTTGGFVKTKVIIMPASD